MTVTGGVDDDVAIDGDGGADVDGVGPVLDHVPSCR
jgi:hypothetical protein